MAVGGDYKQPDKVEGTVAMSGQYALEQTFIIPREALVTQQVAAFRPRTRTAV